MWRWRSLLPSGMLPHHLNLKVGAIVKLLRNLDIHQDLCNGTRLTGGVCKIVPSIVKRFLDPSKDIAILILRITLTPSDMLSPLKLGSRQFPVRLSFDMLIDKAKGQMFDRRDLFLPQFSRVRSLAQSKSRLSKKETVQKPTERKISFLKGFLQTIS